MPLRKERIAEVKAQEGRCLHNVVPLIPCYRPWLPELRPVPVLLELDIGAKPGIEEPLSGLVVDGGENKFGGRGAPFGICGTRFVPRGLETGDWDMPTP